MKVYRDHLIIIVVAFCALALMLTLVSYLDTQTNRMTYWNMDRESLRSMEMTSAELRYDEDADIVMVTIEYTTDEEFDVWLVDDAEFDLSDSLFGIDNWLRHGIAGGDVIEWSVSADEYDGTLMLVEENAGFGERGSLFGGSTVNYDHRITTRSLVDPMESAFTWAAMVVVVMAAVLLIGAVLLPKKVIPDYSELYPGSIGPTSTDDDLTG